MSMLDLRRTQEWLATAITTGECVDDGIARAGQAGGIALAADLVTRSSRMSARDRLGVYHHAYRARLVECLTDDYPALRHALGGDEFERLCHGYIAQHASTSFSLNFFGASMSEFCHALEEPCGGFASDLAALEWTIVEVIHAPASAPLDASVLAEIGPDGWSARRLVANNALRIVRSRYPVNAYYQAFRDGIRSAAPPPPAQSTTAVARSDMTVWRTSIPQALVPVLDALLDGVTLGDALGTAIASEAEISRAFRDWISTGIFVCVE
jgi:hypothetical protein